MKFVKFLKIVLASVVGVMVFFLMKGLISYLLPLIARIPYMSTVIYWPAPFPLIANILPPLCAIYVASFTSDAIGHTAKPLSILLMVYYGYEIVMTLIGGAVSWQGILASVLGIAISFTCFH